MSLTVLRGCGYNGFSQLDGFKFLDFDKLGQVVLSKDCTIIRSEQRKKVVLPETLVKLNRQYNLDNLLFTWSRIALTLKKGLDFNGYTSVISGFTNLAVQEKDHCGIVTVVDEHIVSASTDTDILLSELKDTHKKKIVHEKSDECKTVIINLPSQASTVQIVCGGHQNFFAVSDSITFGKLCPATAKNTEVKENEDNKVIHLMICPIDSGITINEISCGKDHTLILSQFGTVYSYGLGSRGQLGHGSVDPESSPRLLEALEGVRMRRVCAGAWHSASLSDFGDVYLWGWNESGQLGMSTLSKDDNNYQSAEEFTGIQAQPRSITLPDDLNISTVACGSRHTVLLTDAGRVFSSGWNAYGQLGLGDTESRDRFTEVVTVDFCIKIFAGHWNSMFVCNSNKEQPT
uniref:RCC1 domain-containing protein 1 n=1 Tax=Arion vulgaris TaxID=1028688 RepID=A0A0B6Z785_9EUPU